MENTCFSWWWPELGQHPRWSAHNGPASGDLLFSLGFSMHLDTCAMCTDTHVHINNSHEPEQGILHPWEDYELVLTETVITRVWTPDTWQMVPDILKSFVCLFLFVESAFYSWSSCQKCWDCRRASSCLTLLLFLIYWSIRLYDVNISVRMCIWKPELAARCSLYYSLP